MRRHGEPCRLATLRPDPAMGKGVMARALAVLARRVIAQDRLWVTPSRARGSWRLFDFRFSRHPTFGVALVLAVAIYLNFFAHHYLPDAPPLLFVAVAWLFGPCWIHFRIGRAQRRMSLLLGFVQVALVDLAGRGRGHAQPCVALSGAAARPAHGAARQAWRVAAADDHQLRDAIRSATTPPHGQWLQPRGSVTLSRLIPARSPAEA